MLLTVGERVSMALLSMALNSLGCRAISFTGSQSGIVTSVGHTRALIEEIRAGRIEEALVRGQVVIVAGFQGVSRAREITTLGRGGSDTTAVALAARLGAARCEIYSDVPGVFTADPRIVRGARLLPRVGYDEIVELAALGAKVLHFRAAELARRYCVPLHLLSSFDDPRSTVVGNGGPVEKESITGVTARKDVALIHAKTQGPGICGELMRALANREIQVMSYARSSEDGGSRLSFIVDAADLSDALLALNDFAKDATWTTEERLAQVSMVGTGLSANATRVIGRVEELLAGSGVSVRQVGTSPLSVSFLVPSAASDRAVMLIHSAFIDSQAVSPT